MLLAGAEGRPPGGRLALTITPFGPVQHDNCLTRQDLPERGALDPLSYLVSTPFVVSIATTATRRVNERSMQLEAFENVEEAVIDLYSAVRNGYLQRRRGSIHPRRAEWRAVWCKEPPEGEFRPAAP